MLSGAFCLGICPNFMHTEFGPWMGPNIGAFCLGIRPNYMHTEFGPRMGPNNVWVMGTRTP